jgi:uncharacterized protein (DUF2236 family)
MDAARKVVGERLVVLGWGRALLMQVAHPSVAAAIEDHSAFRATPLAPFRRLHRTVRAMREMLLGSPDRAERAAARIRAVHDRIHGRVRDGGGAGARYSAHDPALLLWVHATLVDSFLLVYETLVGPLAPREKDRACVDAARANARIGLPEERCPRDVAALASLLDAARRDGTLRVGDGARRIAHAVLHPPFSFAAGPAAVLHRDVAIGTLPSWIRDLYGLPWSAADERRLRERAETVRRLRARTPEVLALWPEARGASRRRAARSPAYSSARESVTSALAPDLTSTVPS